MEKKGIMWDTLGWWIIILVVLVILVIALFAMRGNMSTMWDKIVDAMRFGG